MKKYLLILCLFIVSTTNAMHNGAKVHWQQYQQAYKTWFFRGMKTAHWGIAGAPFLYNAARSFDNYRNASIEDYLNEDASPRIHTFIKTILKPLAMGDTDLYVKMNPEAYDEKASSSYDRATQRKVGVITLANSNEYLERLVSEYESKEMQEPMSPELARLIGNIQHEASHIKHNDQLKSAIVAPALAPFITHMASKVVSALMHRPPAALPSFARSTLFLPSAIVKFCISSLLIDGYSRYIEQRADNHIENKPELLEAQIDQYREAAENHNGCFSRSAPEIIDAYKQGDLNLFETIGWLKQQFGLDYCSLFINYPQAKIRADRFQKRFDSVNSQSASNGNPH